MSHTPIARRVAVPCSRATSIRTPHQAPGGGTNVKHRRRRLALAPLSVALALLACNAPARSNTPAPAPVEVPFTTAAPRPTLPAPTTSATSAGSAGRATTIPTETAPPSPGPPRTTIEDLMVRCPSPDEVASVDRDLRLVFVSEPTEGSLVCTSQQGSVDLTLFQKNLYHAILAMRWIKFDEPLPWTDLSLYEWFTGAVNGVRVDDHEGGSACCTSDGLILIAPHENFFTVHTDRFLRDRAGQGGFPGINGVDTLMMLLIHEARHNEGYAHACPDGGDRLISDMGSWSLVYYTHLWLANHTDPEFMRSQVRAHDWYAEAYLGEARWMENHRFCGEPSYTPSP